VNFVRHSRSFVTGLCRAGLPEAVRSATDGLLGGTRGRAQIELLICSVCGDRGCGTITADVEIAEHTVTCILTVGVSL
jgi:hypothetical protein